MRLSILFYGLIALQPVVGCASPPAVKTTVRVVDEETGSPVSNATVSTVFLVEDSWGKPDQYQKIEKVSDSQGLCTLAGNDLDHYFNAKINIDGYYQSLVKIDAKKLNRVLRRWEPWDQTVEVAMRRKQHPVMMKYKYQDWTAVPEFGKPIGYDLEAGDWVAPHGNGKTDDFLFLMNLDRKSMSDAEASYTLSFSNPLDGIQEYLPPDDLRSSFIFPYVAPTNGYKATLYQHDINKPYASPKTTEKENINYIFRIRTKTDKGGEIISACYGRIKGELNISRKGQVKFEYWFNPIPNSRSLESDKEPY